MTSDHCPSPSPSPLHFGECKLKSITAPALTSTLPFDMKIPGDFIVNVSYQSRNINIIILYIAYS